VIVASLGNGVDGRGRRGGGRGRERTGVRIGPLVMEDAFGGKRSNAPIGVQRVVVRDLAVHPRRGFAGDRGICVRMNHVVRGGEHGRFRQAVANLHPPEEHWLSGRVMRPRQVYLVRTHCVYSHFKRRRGSRVRIDIRLRGVPEIVQRGSRWKARNAGGGVSRILRHIPHVVRPVIAAEVGEDEL